MASFLFAEAANTTLQTIDALWSETTSGHTVTDGAGNVWSSSSPNSYTNRFAWYPNGQGDTQQSEIDVLAHPAGTFVRAIVQKTSTQIGYRVSCSSGAGGTIELRRNDVYLTDAVGTGLDPSTTDYTLKITYNHTTGVVKGYINGVEKVSYTDASPLTGGYPGFFLYGNGETTNRPKISRWTDNVSAAAAASLLAPPAAITPLLVR